jgi:nucleoid DNA-binding protein
VKHCRTGPGNALHHHQPKRFAGNVDAVAKRIGRNPKTGVEVPIAPRRVMTFRASQIMRDRITKG